MIDTLKVSKSFEDAGFAKAQADTLAVTLAEATSASREDLVTKEFLRAELAAQKNDLVRWLPGSQILLAALVNFTRMFG